MGPSKPVAPMVIFTAVILFSAAKAGAQTNGCTYPNTSMISTTACTPADSDSSLMGLIACLTYLEEDEALPSAKCCAGVKNVSTLHPPCLCKVTFYPPPSVNVTRQKLMPGLCNVTSDLCTACNAFVVARVAEEPPANSAGDKIRMYKNKVIGLAVVLGLVLACLVVGLALLIRRKLKARKSTPPPTKTNFQTRQPGSDY